MASYQADAWVVSLTANRWRAIPVELWQADALRDRGQPVFYGAHGHRVAWAVARRMNQTEDLWAEGEES